MPNIKMVGFDIRELWLAKSGLWVVDDGSLLIDQTVEKPLSVDTTVWFSAFSEAKSRYIWERTNRLSQYQTPQWSNYFVDNRRLTYPDNFFMSNRGLWANLGEMIGFAKVTWGLMWNPSAVIAVVELVIDEDYEDYYEKSKVEISPDSIHDLWHFLGYDVADYDLYSGLYNGRIGESVTRSEIQTWKRKLNQFHLFNKPDDAFDYIDLANRRHPGHQPYNVYGLYLINTINTGVEF